MANNKYETEEVAHEILADAVTGVEELLVVFYDFLTRVDCKRHILHKN